MVFDRTMTEARADELTGAALNWAVGVATMGGVFIFPEGGCCPPENSLTLNHEDLAIWINDGEGHHLGEWSPTTDWDQGGPLVDEHILSLRVAVEPKAGWDAVGGVKYSATAVDQDGCGIMCFGDTRLIAVCRAVVEATAGRIVTVPAALLN